MRNKPTIIAFKTPSLESYEATKKIEEKGLKLLVRAVAILTLIVLDEINVDESQAVEEGKVEEKAVNFPVGKPLEVMFCQV